MEFQFIRYLFRSCSFLCPVPRECHQAGRIQTVSNRGLKTFFLPPHPHLHSRLSAAEDEEEEGDIEGSDALLAVLYENCQRRLFLLLLLCAFPFSQPFSTHQDNNMLSHHSLGHMSRGGEERRASEFNFRTVTCVCELICE